MMSRLSRSRALALAAAAVFAPARAVHAQAAAHLTVVTSPSDAGGEVYYAQELGTFKKYGLDADIISLRGGAAVAAAMSSGQYRNPGKGNVVSIAAAREKGDPLRHGRPGEHLRREGPYFDVDRAERLSDQVAGRSLRKDGGEH